MTEQPVLTEKQGKELWIQFNRPDDQNRIDRNSMEILTESLDRIDEDPEIAVVIVTGSDDYFCSGGRVDTASTELEKARYGRAITHLHEKFAQVRPPVIAVVSGHCRAGGMAILAATDVAIAADDVNFGFPEITHGGFPVMAMASTMPLLPPKIAFDLYYSGRDMTAQEAHQLGLVSSIVPRGSLETTVKEYIETITSRPPEVMALGRRAFYGMEPMSPESRLKYGKEILQSVLRK